MNGLEYKVLHHSEGFGNHGAFGIKIMVAASTLPDLDSDAIRFAVYKATDIISSEVKAAIISLDPKEKDRTEKEKEQLLNIFPEKIFYESIPNEYCSDYCCRHLPWYMVTTVIGHFKIGWRKRVLNIDWSKTLNKKHACELFPEEDVTKGKQYIHAWSYEKAKQYIDKILGV